MKATIKILTSVLLIAMTVALVSFNLPNGWVKRGDSPEKYDAGIDKGAGQNGKNAATIKSIEKNIEGFGSLVQNFNPSKFLGKKIKLTGYLKSNDVSGSARLWMRIDQPNKYSLENMQDRFIRGNSDWTKCEIVLDVPMDTKNIAFGGLLYGTGQIWFDNLKIEIASNSEKVTGELQVGDYEYKNTLAQNTEPINLDFEK
ncbi:MAG: hypothetical protein ACHQNT_04840 [Bacteroidia bacterium]